MYWEGWGTIVAQNLRYDDKTTHQTKVEQQEIVLFNYAQVMLPFVVT
jgi:hypothetical protein